MSVSQSVSPTLSISSVLGTRLRPDTTGWTEQKLENSEKLILPFYNFIWWNLKPPWPHFCVSWTPGNYKSLFVNVESDSQGRDIRLFNYWRRSREWRGAAARLFSLLYSKDWGVLSGPKPSWSAVELFINWRDCELLLIFRGREGKLQFVIKWKVVISCVILAAFGSWLGPACIIVF